MSAQDDVEEFAALLRALKERTDRSYGSLARRLAMNTSTLHRYCAGEAVPLDFAPVERFAALCGATPEERLELHRRWLLAAAARQRPRTPGTASAAIPAAAETDGPENEPAVLDGPPDVPAASDDPPGRPDTASHLPGGGAADNPAGQADEPGAASVAGTASHLAGEPDAARGPAGQTGETNAAGEPAGRPGTASRPAGEPGAAGTAAGGAGAVGGPVGGLGPARPWYRRRRVGVAVGAVCALLAALGSLSAVPDGRRPAAGSAPTAWPSASAPPATPPSASPHRSPSTPPASPSPSPDRPSPTAGPGKTSPAAPGTPTPGRTDPVPLTWTADSQAWAQGCGHDYVIAKPPRQVSPPPPPQDARPWAAAQGAVHGGETIVELSVQGRTGTAVVLKALRVRVVGRTAPVQGNAYAMDQGCGGALTPRHFAVNLDMDRPLARAVPGNDAGTPIPAVNLPYRVSAREPEVLLVTARTGTCDCRWYLELDWSSQGRTGTVRIDDDGRPFRTSGIKGLPRYTYDTSAREWRPYG